MKQVLIFVFKQRITAPEGLCTLGHNRRSLIQKMQTHQPTPQEISTGQRGDMFEWEFTCQDRQGRPISIPGFLTYIISLNDLVVTVSILINSCIS
jgi:hypothetical protein